MSAERQVLVPDLQQRLSTLNGVARLYVKCGDGAVVGGCNFGFHLHGFKNDDYFAGRNGLAFLNKHFADGTSQRCRKPNWR